MGTILFAPPIAFAIYWLLSAGISALSKRLAAVSEDSENKEKAYACGEDIAQNQAQPDYREFFKFAFFFTIMHVIALVVATDPEGLTLTSVVYFGVTVLSLFMLLRR